MASLRRVLRTFQVTLSHVFAPDEIPTAATGSVNIQITRLDGTIVVASTPATGPDENDAYTYLYGGSATLDDLVVTWTATVAGDAVTLDQDRLEIVGAHLFSITEAREFDDAIANPIKYPSTLLESTRIEVEDEFEGICDQAFVPRFCRETLDGNGTFALRLTNPLTRVIRKVSVANVFGQSFVDFTSAQLATIPPGRDGVLRLDQGFAMTTPGWIWGAVWPIGRQNVLVEYEHGADGPGSNVSRAGKIRERSMLLETRSALPDRSESTSTAAAIASAMPDEDSTGIPAVDAILSRVPRPRPSFG